VKTALRMVLRVRRFDRRIPALLRCVTHSRTSGTDYRLHSPTWISWFTDMTRQAASYRKGRVLSDRMAAAGLLGPELAAGRPVEITLAITDPGQGWRAGSGSGAAQFSPTSLGR
jgi:hypothetical protein